MNSELAATAGAPGSGSKPGSALLLGLALAAVGALGVAAVRWPWVPAPQDWLTGRTAIGDVWPAALGAATVAAVVIAAVARWSRRGSAAGGFAAVAATVLAAGMPLLAAATAPVTAAPLLGLLAAVVLVPPMLPLLRERSLLSLVVVAAVAAGPGALAARLAQQAAFACRPLAAAQRAAADLPPDVEAVALVLDDSIDADTACAFAAALWPRRVLAARRDTREAEWLSRMELPALHCAFDRCTLQSLGDRGLRRSSIAVEVALARGEGGEVAAVSVSCRDAGAGHVAVLFGPAGSSVAAMDADGRARFSGADAEQLQRGLAAVPSGAAIRVLVVPPPPADAYGWTELRP